MKLGDFLKGRLSAILLNFIGIIILSIFLFSVGNTIDTIITVAAVWTTVFLIFLTYTYSTRKMFYHDLMKTAEKLDKKYLMGEVIDQPPFLEARPYYDLLKVAGKSMLEEINLVKRQRKDYKEYIEQWVHEVKTPISAIKLIMDNNRTNISRTILEELESIDRYVEQALFFARSEDTQKDYLIKEISLKQCVDSVLIRNKQMFILNKIDLEFEHIDKNVYCDSKWLEFIINQIVVNSVKYRSSQQPMVKIYSKDIKNGVQLIIEDNGIGIPAHEISRIFDKGYTGSKGRYYEKSTGIGLYLCKLLCDKLGLILTAESEENVYTKMTISFPIGNFCKAGAI
ncbi:sensor histidine kinase [Fusibacter bizertensis]